VLKETNRSEALIPLDTDLREFRKRQRLRIGRKGRISVRSVSPQVPSSELLASLWDQTSLTEFEDEVLRGLRLVDEGIVDLAFVDDDDAPMGSRRVPMIRHEKTKEPLPLKSLGDGILRIFHIVLALVNARDGILLIDEAENGIHWTVQPKLWDLIFRLSERLNVQVFATTHSRDCIAGFEQAWQADPEAGAFYRLDLTGDGDVTATSYTCETLADALETDVEVR
jgi:hypothetical protein